MKQLSLLITLASALFIFNTNTTAVEATKKLTCCQEAKAKGKECSHKCCITAHKKSESCTRCNPDKEDLEKKGAKKVDKAIQK